MTDLKQLFGSYNLCARFAPGFLFILAVYFLLGYDIEKLESNSLIFITLIIILSIISGFASASLIKFIEWFVWKNFNPTIYYLKSHHKELYKNLLLKYKDDKQIIINILTTTREDSKLLWKNIAYGFFRNSILLSFICLFFSCQTQYLYWNLGICLFIVFMTFVSTCYYAHQAIESYKEIISKGKANA